MSFSQVNNHKNRVKDQNPSSWYEASLFIYWCVLTELICVVAPATAFQPRLGEELLMDVRDMTSGVTSFAFLTPGFQWELNLLRFSPHHLWWTEDNSVQFRLLLSAAHPPQQLCPNCPGRLKLSYPLLLLGLRVNIVVVSFSCAPDQPLNSSFQQHLGLTHPRGAQGSSSTQEQRGISLKQLLWQWISECPEQRALLELWLGSIPRSMHDELTGLTEVCSIIYTLRLLKHLQLCLGKESSCTVWNSWLQRARRKLLPSIHLPISWLSGMTNVQAT